jgi:hypothetical protein
MFEDWLDLYKQIREAPLKKSELVCPECGSTSIDFQYVGDVSERVGYLDLWCAACNKGVHLSRVSIPKDTSLISFDGPDEVIAARIPNYEPVVPSTSAKRMTDDGRED